MVNAKSMGVVGQYQKLKPITDKNIGKDLLKGGHKEYPKQGDKEVQRRLKQQLRIQEKK